MEDICHFFIPRMDGKLSELDTLPTQLIKELLTVPFPSCYLKILCKMIVNADLSALSDTLSLIILILKSAFV